MHKTKPILAEAGVGFVLSWIGKRKSSEVSESLLIGLILHSQIFDIEIRRITQDQRTINKSKAPCPKISLNP